MKGSPLLIALCIFFLFNMLLLWALPGGPVAKCQLPMQGVWVSFSYCINCIF